MTRGLEGFRLSYFKSIRILFCRLKYIAYCVNYFDNLLLGALYLKILDKTIFYNFINK